MKKARPVKACRESLFSLSLKRLERMLMVLMIVSWQLGNIVENLKIMLLYCILHAS